MYAFDVKQSNFDFWGMEVYSFIIIPLGFGIKITLGERVPSKVFSERHGDMVPPGGWGELLTEKCGRKMMPQNRWSGKQMRVHT